MPKGLKFFWWFYALAVGIAILGMLWAVFAGTVIWPWLYGEPLQPDPYSGVSVMMKANEAKYGLPPDSFFASLLLVGDHWFLVLMYLFPLAPTLAAIIMLWRTEGGAGVKHLFKLYKPVGPTFSAVQGVKFYFALVFFIIAFGGLMMAAQGTYEEGIFERAKERYHLDIPFYALFFLIWGIFTSHGAFMEELGWRGYVWPRIQVLFSSPLAASLFLGIFWAAWHLPREFVMIGGGAPVMPIVMSQMNFFIACMASSVIMGYVFNLSGGSILPVIMVHGALNFFHSTFDSEPFFLSFQIGALMWVLSAIVLVIIVGKQLGLRPKEEMI